MSKPASFPPVSTSSGGSTGAKGPAVLRRKRPLWRLLQLARPELLTLGLATGALLISSGLTLIYPQAIKIIVNAVSAKGGGGLINQTTLILLILFAFEGVFSTLRSYLFTVAGGRIVARLRRDLYAALLRQEMAFFDETQSGELASRLNADTTVLQDAVTGDIANVVRYCMMLVGATAILFFTSWRLTLVMLMVVPIMVIGAYAYGRILRKLANETQTALARANDVAQESLSGIRTVRAFAREDNETKRYEGAVFQVFALIRRCAWIDSIFSGVVMFMIYAVMAVVFWYGGVLVWTGKLHIGDLTAFILYTMMVVAAVGALSGVWTSFMHALGASERVFELLEREPAIPPGKLRLSHVIGEVVFEDTEFSYPTRPNARVLSGLNLQLKPGEVVAVVGHSGAGKSTIAALLSRFYDPQGGRILLDRHDLRLLDSSWLRQQVGVVSQEPLLFATSIIKNICYGKPDATRQEVEAAAKIANAHDFITRLPGGYQTMVGERGVQLSAGQKQRIAIARAVLKDPRILVLDEATSALDAESEVLVQEALDRLMIGRTTLVIAHRLSTVIGAERVVVLDGGKVVQEGCHADLVSRDGIYRRLVERQFAPLAPELKS